MYSPDNMNFLTSFRSRYKCFKLTWLFLVCCLLFTIGFAMREVGAFNYQSLGIYIGSTFCIYLSP